MSVQTSTEAQVSQGRDQIVQSTHRRSSCNSLGKICQKLTPSPRTCCKILIVGSVVGVAAYYLYRAFNEYNRLITNPTEEEHRQMCDTFCLSKSVRNPGITYCNEETNTCYFNGEKTSGQGNIVSLEAGACRAAAEGYKQLWTSFLARFKLN